MTRSTIRQQKLHIGLRLLIAFTLFSVCSLLFAKIAWDVREQETLGFDQAILGWVHGLSRPWIDTTCRSLTQLGGPWFVPVITMMIALVAWLRRYRGHALLLLAGVGGASMLSIVLKLFFARTRPDLWPSLVTETSFAFPSGHAIASSALAASIVAALWFTRWRVTALVAGVVYVLLIGFTRLYLGVHYPTDVIAGWMVGIGWVAAVALIFLSSPLSLKRDQKSKQ